VDKETEMTVRSVRRFLLVVFLLSFVGAFAVPTAFAAPTHVDVVDAGQKKTVHVKEYKRKDGTVVNAHDRRAPGEATGSSSGSSSSGSSTHVAAKSSLTPATTAFMKATGYGHGRPGYVIDHIVPLACGGPDVPSNMQWQTREAAKAKEKYERAGCGK
jgi:hypothetical protein